MTKIYEGNGEYTIHLSTGKEIKLTEIELGEIVHDAEVVEELQHEVKEIKQAFNTLVTGIEKLQAVSDELIDNVG